jgi:GAF domain/ANTAR domain
MRSGRRGDGVAERLDTAIADCLRGRRARQNLHEVLSDITMLAVGLLPQVDHAGVTVVEEGDVIRSLAATDGHPLVLDNIQRDCGEGPCLDSAVGRRGHRVDDLARERRWPVFAERAMTATPVRSLLSLPATRDGHAYAALNLFADRPHVFDERLQPAAAVIARHVTDLVTAFGRPRSLRRCRSDVISSAISLLMTRLNIDGAQAFALLVHISKNEHESIEAVAQQLVESAATTGAVRPAQPTMPDGTGSRSAG